MEKQFVFIGLLVVIGIITVIFGKVIGPKLIDWIMPSFNKATDKLDDAIMGKPDQWEKRERKRLAGRPDTVRPCHAY